MPRSARRIDWPALVAGIVLAYALGGFVLYPLAKVFLDSVTGADGGLTFDHYRETFALGSSSWRAVFNTLWVSLASTAGAAVVGTGLALVLSRVRLPGSRAGKSPT